MESWKSFKLGEVTEVIDCPHSTPIWTDSGIMVIRSSNVRAGRLNFEKVSFTNETHYLDRTRRAKPKAGDLVLTREAPMGEVCIIPENLKCCLGQRVVLLQSIGKIDPKFLLYALLSPAIQHKIKANEGTGSTVSNFRIPDIKKLEIIAPESLPEQEEIASILSSLDDKIEVNLRMNQILQDIAQAIFKEWFIDFKFPRFEGKLADGVPSGWKKKKLSDLISIKHGFAFKGEFFKDEETEDVLVTPGNFKIGGGFNYSKFKYYEGQIPKDYLLSRDDLIVTMTDLSKEGDTLGYPALVPDISGKRLLHNQRIGKILFNDEASIKHYLFWVMRQSDYRHFVLGSATGSTVKHTSPSRICDFEIIVPDNDCLAQFESIAGSLIQKEQENLFENGILLQLRETLLPKLMSGKIEVKA